MLYLLGFILLFAAWLEPLHVLPWVSWHSEVLAFLAVLLMAWHTVIFRSGKGRASPSAIPSGMAIAVSNEIQLPSSALPLLGLGLLVCVQYFSGFIPFFGDALLYSLYCLLCLTAMALGYRSAHLPDGLLFSMACTVLVAAMVSAFIAMAQVFDLARDCSWILTMPYLRRPGGNLGQPNQLATLLLMGVVSVVFLCESRKLGRVPSALTAFVLIVALAATESRAGVLGFGVLMIWWLVKLRSTTSKIDAWHAAIAGFAFLCMFKMWPIWINEFFQIAGGTTATNTVAYNRWIIWPQLVQAILLRPWLGWGVGQVSTAHNAVVDAYDVSEPYTYAHNIVLDLALGLGLPLTMLLVLMVSVWLWRRVSATMQLRSWFCVAFMVPVAVHSLVEFPFAYAYFLVPVMFALGALEAHLGSKPTLKLSAKSVSAGLVIGTGVFIWLAIEYVRIEEDFRIVRFESLRIGQTPSSYERPSVYLLTQLDALLHGGRIVPRPNMPMQEIELARTVALRFPWPATQNRYALSLALNGNPVEASRQLRVMRAQHGPKSFAGIKAAWTLLANERYPELHEIQLPVPLAEKID